LAELDLENAIALRDRLLATKTANTSRRVLAQLNACCKWAVERAILESNPFEGMTSKIKVAKSEADEIDPFDRAEIGAIVRGFETDRYFKHYTPFVKFLFMTGCRTSEAISLQWKHVSNDLSTILFEEAVVDGHRKSPKTRKRKFPSDEKLRELLLSLRSENRFQIPLCLSPPRGKLIDAHNFLNRAWKSVLLKQGIRYRYQYQTRHTFITHCIEKNIPIPQIARWVGNSARIILEHYAGVIEKYQVPSIL
jgi:integrase